MTLAVLHLDLHIPGAGSLKEKRKYVKGFKDRVRHRFNVSVAETDGHEQYRRAHLAIAMVGVDRRYVEGALQQIVNLAATHREMVLDASEIEWL